MPKLDKDEVTTYAIPENFIDEGRIIKGAFKTRNFIEGVVLAFVVFLFANAIPTSGISSKITLLMSICSPFFLLGVNGFNGDSLFQTAWSAFNWFKGRTILLYNGSTRALSKSPLESMMETEAPKDKILDYMAAFKQRQAEKRSGVSYIEGVNFVFAEDEDLVGIYADEDDEDDEDEQDSEVNVGVNREDLESQTNSVVDCSTDNCEASPDGDDASPVVQIDSTPALLELGDVCFGKQETPVDCEEAPTVSMPIRTELEIEGDVFDGK